MINPTEGTPTLTSTLTTNQPPSTQSTPSLGVTLIGIDFEGSGGSKVVPDKAVQIGLTICKATSRETYQRLTNSDPTPLATPPTPPTPPTAPQYSPIATINPWETEAPRALFSSLINPNQYVNRYAYQIHGISTKVLRMAPTFDEIKDRVLDLLSKKPGESEVYFVAHSCSSEKRYLSEILSQSELVSMEHRWLDTLTLCRKFHPEFDNHKLETCLSKLGGKSELETLLPSVSWHDALYDSMASLLILQRLLQRHDIKTKTPEELARLSRASEKKPRKFTTGNRRRK
jgi:DNA polymerase-3 subunit epsilon